MSYGSSKSAKIVLSKSIFCVKNQPTFFKIKICRRIMVHQKVPKLYFQSQKLRLRPNILAKRLGGRSLSQLMENFSFRPINRLIGIQTPEIWNIVLSLKLIFSLPLTNKMLNGTDETYIFSSNAFVFSNYGKSIKNLLDSLF